MTQTAPAIVQMMSPNSIPDVFEIPDPVVLEAPESEGNKQMAWLAALALMAVVVGATLALLVDDSRSETSQVSIVH